MRNFIIGGLFVAILALLMLFGNPSGAEHHVYTEVGQGAGAAASHPLQDIPIVEAD